MAVELGLALAALAREVVGHADAGQFTHQGEADREDHPGVCAGAIGLERSLGDPRVVLLRGAKAHERRAWHQGRGGGSSTPKGGGGGTPGKGRRASSAGVAGHRGSISAAASAAPPAAAAAPSVAAPAVAAPAVAAAAVAAAAVVAAATPPGTARKPFFNVGK